MNKHNKPVALQVHGYPLNQQKGMKHFIDGMSLKLCGITFLGNIFNDMMHWPWLAWFTGMAAASTLIYNVVKTIKELKNK